MLFRSTQCSSATALAVHAPDNHASDESLITTTADTQVQRCSGTSPRAHGERTEILTKPPYAYVEADILDSADDVIIHQTNCVTTNALGLAKDIFQRYPRANTYKNRKGNAEPGSVDITEHHDGSPTIINCNAQFAPGKATPTGLDSKAARVALFKKCLQQVAEYIRGQTKQQVSIAIPWRIGCGLAGGNPNPDKRYDTTDRRQRHRRTSAPKGGPCIRRSRLRTYTALGWASS